MSAPTREEVDGLGKRINDMEKECIACRTSKEEQIKMLREDRSETKSDISKLFSMFDGLKSQLADIDKKMSVMWAKVSVAVAILVFAINLIDKFLPIGN